MWPFGIHNPWGDVVPVHRQGLVYNTATARPDAQMYEDDFLRWVHTANGQTLNEWWPGCDRMCVQRDYAAKTILLLTEELLQKEAAS